MSGSPPTRPLSIVRAARLGELYLLWHLAFSLILEWRARLDPITTLGLIVDLGAGAISNGERERLREALAEESADPEPLASPAFLEAATRWYCSLRLPADEEELMAARGQARGGLIWF